MLPSDIHPRPGWVFCKALRPVTETAGGLHLAKDMEKDVVSEGVAEVLSVGAPEVGPEGDPFPVGVAEGDKVLYRGFLRFAQPCGHLLGAAHGFDYFLLSAKDIMAVLEGSGRAGFYGEYLL